MVNKSRCVCIVLVMLIVASSLCVPAYAYEDIATLLADYGVIYDVNQVEGSLNYLQTYGTPTGGAYSDMKHYVAGEGFDSSTPSRRICYYYDSNTLDRLGTHHMQVTFQVMAVLCNDMGLVY